MFQIERRHRPTYLDLIVDVCTANTPVALLYSPVLGISSEDVLQVPDGDVRAFTSKTSHAVVCTDV